MISTLLMYSLLLVFVFLLQRKLIYFPETYTQDRQPELISQFNLKPWPEESYRGLISQNDLSKHKGTILVFHGNAGSARGRFYYIEALERLGYRVILAEYPGYGSRNGKPSEPALIEDGLKSALLAQEQFGDPLFLWGESIGSGIVSGIVKTEKIKTKGIVLMTPFDSMANVAQHHYWYFLAKWLIQDQFDNVTNLRNYSGNTAVILAEEDEIIPNRNTMKLYESISGKKKLWEFAEAGHNSLPIHPRSRWWEEVMNFVNHTTSEQAPVKK